MHHYFLAAQEQWFPDADEVEEAQRMVKVRPRLPWKDLVPCYFTLAIGGLDVDRNTTDLAKAAALSPRTGDPATDPLAVLPDALAAIFRVRENKGAASVLAQLEIPGAPGVRLQTIRGEIAMSHIQTLATAWTLLTTEKQPILIQSLVKETDADPDLRKQIRKGLKSTLTAERTLCREILRHTRK